MPYGFGEGFTMTIKGNNDNLVYLYPNTTRQQVVGWGAGEVYGPYIITLSSAAWNNNQQTVQMQGVNSTDLVICCKAMVGDDDSTAATNLQYANLKDVQSGENEIIFSCYSAPTANLPLQVFWTR